MMKTFQSLWVVVFGVLCLGLEKEELQWRPATATWYGSPDGDGSDGGACGYGSLVDMKPFRKRVSAVSPVLFKGGEGCGACYKVKCLDDSICAERAVTVIVTDACPGCAAFSTSHFDLTGAAFGRMAVAGHASALLNTGELPILYKRTICKYPGRNLTFHVNDGSSNYWFSILIEYEDGDGDVGAVHIKEAESESWMEMKHLSGANWFVFGGPMKPPFSLRITSLSSQNTLSAMNVIPQNWFPNATYKSRVNFDD